jgi:hypothetical protein
MFFGTGHHFVGIQVRSSHRPSKEGESPMFNRFSFIAAILLACNAITIFAADPEAESNAPAAPSGHFLVHEELWSDLSDEPGEHMDRARNAFLAVDVREAAAQIRKSATYLRITAAQAVDGSKRALLRSAHELEGLAHRVEAGTVKSVGELDAAFARALHSLSHHHTLLAERAWIARQNELAGKQLRAAADNLEKAAARTGHALQTATVAVAKETRLVAGKLLEGTGFVVDEIGKGFAKFGKQVEEVGKGIEPHPAQAASDSVPQKK